MATSVQTPLPVVSSMQIDWNLVDALRGGTRAMREAGQVYLPKRALEEPEDYQNRLQSATLFPAYSETLRSHVGRVFAKPVMVGDDVPAWIRDEVLPDVDMQGRNLHVFAADWFEDALNYGLSHVLIDAPMATEEVRTQADQRRAGLRPYLVQISPRRVLGWRFNGSQLSQLRVQFSREEPDGEFGVRTVEQVRVYEPGRVRLYELDRGGWQMRQEIATGLDFIPIVTLYTNRTAPMQASPPLRELAYLNVKHWQQQSSADTLLDTASVPLLTLIGADSDQQIVIGGKYAVRLPREADMKFVEHSGAAIGAGREALEALKEEMRQAGAKLLAPQGTGTKTAAQATEEAARENSALGQMAQALEDALDEVLDMIALWRRENDGGSIKVQPNLDPDWAPAESMGVLINMRNAGALSDATLFAEAQRRGLIRDDIEWEDEQARVGGSVE